MLFLQCTVIDSLAVLRRRNGLYGPGAYTIALTIIRIPFLFGCSALYATIGYNLVLNSVSDQN